MTAADFKDNLSRLALDETDELRGQRNSVRLPFTARFHLPRLSQSSFFSMSLTEDLIAELRLGYMLALTSSSKPSK